MNAKKAWTICVTADSRDLSVPHNNFVYVSVCAIINCRCISKTHEVRQRFGIRVLTVSSRDIGIRVLTVSSRDMFCHVIVNVDLFLSRNSLKYVNDLAFVS